MKKRAITEADREHTVKEIKVNYDKFANRVSEITRATSFGIIGTIWLLSFKGGSFQPICPLKWAVFGFVCFLFVDFVQYATLAIASYVNHYRIDRKIVSLEKHEQIITGWSVFSVVSLALKILIFLISSAFFVCGVASLL